jgi:hypothetical protein
MSGENIIVNASSAPASATGACSLDDLLQRAKRLAADYYALTGRPLGLTGEIGELEACRILKLEACSVRQAGYDAVRMRDGIRERIQIKTRCLGPNAKRGQRVGSIQRSKEWDAVMMVILDAGFNAVEIWEADREAVVSALNLPGSIARNERGALAVSKFKSIGRRIWPLGAERRSP